MKIRLYSVCDNVAQQFGIPVSFGNDGVANRGFIDLVHSGDSQIAKHPEDHDLWFLGELDTVTGDLSSAPALVMKGSAVPQKLG